MERKRKPNRSEEEKIQDVFFDMSHGEQAGLLATLQTLHRLKGRQLESDAQEPHQRAVAATRALDKPPLLDGMDAAVDIAGALKSALAVKRPERTPGAATIPVEGIVPE